MFADDASNPIPSVNNLDVVAKRRTGGADLVIIVTKPMDGDEPSLRRLMQKIENYLGFILSGDFEQEFGPPDPSKARIVVKIDKRSDPAVFELLRQCEPWALDNKTTLVIDTDMAH